MISFLYKNKNIMIVVLSNIINVAFGFLINIIATQILSVSDYGYYKAFITSLQLFGSLINFGIYYTIGKLYAEQKGDDFNSILHTSTVLILVSIHIIAFVTISIATLIVFYFGFIIPTYVLLGLALSIIILFQNYFLQKYQSQKRFIRYSIISIYSNLSLFIFCIAFYLLGIQIIIRDLIIFYSLANLVFYFFFITFERNGKPSRNSITDIISTNRKHGLQLYYGSLFSVSIAYLLSILIAGISGLEEYAFYSLGNSLAAPLIYIPTSFTTIYYSSYVSITNIPIKKIIIVLSFTVLSAITLFSGVYFFIPSLVGVIYSKSVYYTGVLLIYYFLIGFGDFINRFLYIKGFAKKIRNLSVANGLTLIIFASLLIPYLNINGLIIAKILSGVVYLGLLVIIYYKNITKKV